MYLVTGGAGFIGSHIVERLVATDEKVRVLDNFSLGSKANLRGLEDKVEVIIDDILDQAVVGGEGLTRTVEYFSEQIATYSTAGSNASFGAAK